MQEDLGGECGPCAPARRLARPLAGVRKGVMVLMLVGLSGCASYMPYAGPRTGSVAGVQANQSLRGIQLVDVNYAVAHYIRTALERPSRQELTAFVNPDPNVYTVGPGDTLQVYIWEAPPAMLFRPDTNSMMASPMTTIPRQMVGSGGNIFIPFAGKIACSSRTLSQIGAEIRKRLKAQAHDPQVVVRLVKNHAQSVAVVGNVKRSAQVPLTPGGVNVLQALAAAGGVDKPVGKVTIQISRSGKVLELPLENIVRNPQDNISLRPGDVVTALYQPLHVTIMGSVNATKEVDFEATGISLAQALTRAGGLNGNEADAKGVFVFRFEKPSVLPGKYASAHPMADGLVPVVFRFDLSNPATLFAAQEFPIQNHDLIYVSPAPITDLQKFLGLIIQIVYPIQGLTTAGVIR